MDPCKTCKFFQHHPDEIEGEMDAGYCRRHAPVMVRQAGAHFDVSAFPGVDGQGCGDWQDFG